jgi:uncharacterized membrane protein
MEIRNENNDVLDQVDNLAKRFQGEDLERYTDALEVANVASKYMEKYGYVSIEIRQPEAESRGE